MSSITPIKEIDTIILSFLTPQTIRKLHNKYLYDLKLNTSTTPLSKLYQFTITSDISRLQSHLPTPPLPIHKNLFQTAIKHSSPQILQYLISHSPSLTHDTEQICDHIVTATHSNKSEHLKLLLDIFDTYPSQTHDLYYSRHTLYINFDYCFNYAYAKDHWQLVNIFVNNHHVNRMLSYINPKFKNLLYKFHTTINKNLHRIAT